MVMVGRMRGGVASTDVVVAVAPPSLLFLTVPIPSPTTLPSTTVVVVGALVVVAVGGGGGGGGFYNPRPLKRLSLRATVLLLPVPAAAGSGGTRGLKRCCRIEPALSGRTTILA